MNNYIYLNAKYINEFKNAFWPFRTWGRGIAGHLVFDLWNQDYRHLRLEENNKPFRSRTKQN